MDDISKKPGGGRGKLKRRRRLTMITMKTTWDGNYYVLR